MKGVAWVLLLIGFARPLCAQPVPATADSDLEIRLITFGPGPLPWEHFGHNALWVRQPSRGLDVLFNYGIFDLSEQGFVMTFIRGRMLYIMAGQSPRTIDAYLAANRSAWIQDLRLTLRQRVELRDFLLNNARVENRAYRYHYYNDNCSTRIRDALDRVLDGRIRDQIGSNPTGHTFRFHTQRLTVQDIPLYTGLLIGLGNPVDRPIDVWQEMFLPLALREHLNEVTVLDADGNEVPLVTSDRTLNLDTRYDGLDRPPAWMLYYLAVGVLVAGALWWLGRPGGGTGRTVSFVTLGTLWAFLSGAGGAILAFLWLFTDHTTSYWNENLFFFNPAALVLVLTLPLVAFGVSVANRISVAVARFVIAVGVLGFVIQVLPGFDQVNGQVIALMLPPDLSLAVAVLARVRRRETSR